MVKWLKEKDVLLRLLAVVFAILMWLYVIDEENPDYSNRYRNIPLQIDGMEQLSQQGLTIVDGGDATVSAKLSGKRDRMQMVSNDKLLAIVDVSSLTEPGVYTLNYTVKVDVSDVTVTTKNPQQITIEVERYTSKSVPVVVKLTGSLASNLETSGYKVTPDAITVRGPEDLVNKIASASIGFNLDGVTSSVVTNLTYTFLDDNGNTVKDSLLTVDRPSVELQIPLTMTKEVPLSVAYYSSDLISEDLIQATISVPFLMLKGDPDVMRNLNYIQVGSISLRNMIETEKRDYSFFFTLPNNVSYAEGQSSVNNVSVHIEIPGYATKEITASNLNFIGVQDFSYETQEIVIRAFGPEEALANLTAADFLYEPSYTASALRSGKQTILMRITDKDEAVKVLGSYAVKVRVPAK